MKILFGARLYNKWCWTFRIFGMTCFPLMAVVYLPFPTPFISHCAIQTVILCCPIYGISRYAMALSPNDFLRSCSCVLIILCLTFFFAKHSKDVDVYKHAQTLTLINKRIQPYLYEHFHIRENKLTSNELVDPQD